MKMRRSPTLPLFLRWLLFLAAVAGLTWGGSLARAQEVFLICDNEFYPPFDAFDLPCYPQILNVDLTVLTDTNSLVKPHGVTVVNTLAERNVSEFSFDVLSQGVVTPNLNSKIHSYGPSPNGTNQQYNSTVFGVYSFLGDNFPLSAWPDDPNWKDPPVITYLQFNLDQALTSKRTPDNSKNQSVLSEYYYTAWAWSSFLGYELPYLPGATQVGPDSYSYTFDLRKGVKQGPCPYGCPVSSAPGKTCSSCNHNMAGASLDLFQAGIAITDTPISYSPAVGMNMAFSVDYHQRMTNLPSTSICSNLGPQWQFNWISYISGGPTAGQDQATYDAPGGSQYTFSGYERTPAQGTSATFANTGDFQNNEGWSHATLHYEQNPEQYDLVEPDGTVLTFAQPITTASGRLFFLSFITDPQGLSTYLNYDATAAVNGQAILTSVTDPLNGQLIFSYDSANPLQIVKVTRSNDGLSASFQYTNGMLSSITDPIGITSSFQYAAGSYFVSSMTTPYGTTTFNSSDGTGYLEADITNPLGQNERVEYQESLPTSDISDYGSAVPVNSNLVTDASTLNQANSFYWNRRAMADASGVTVDTAQFYALAQVTHWAQGGQGSIAVPLSVKNRLEGRVWYNYPNQSNVDYVVTDTAGATTSPSVTARLVDNTGSSTATQVYLASYNSNGLITQSIDPLGRTTNYTYASNGIDLTQVTQTDGGGQDVLSTMTYNTTQAPLHVPLTVTDASDRTTTLTYNSIGQLLTSTVVVSGTDQTTSNTYYSSGTTNDFLETVTAPATGATTTYTYNDSGLVASVTDSEGYTLAYGYDNLDRVTSVTYPGTPVAGDTKTDLTFYNNLDVVKTVDRQGRATTNQYDAIRQLLSTTDPLGRTTSYTWCTCGGLSTLTDPNGNVTTWGLDGEGRVTSKTYASGSSSTISYTYGNNTSRLMSVTDARGTVAAYAYNTDNTLASTTYTPGSGVPTTPSPNVSFTYDPVYNRVTSMSDATGTNSYSYNAVYSSGSPITGGGRLASVITPIAGTGDTATVAYTYDELGRVVDRTIDGTNSVTTTTFDSLGRVTGVSNVLGSFGYTYVSTPGPSNRLASVTYPNGQLTSYSYFGNTNTDDNPGDGDQRLETISNSISGTNVSTFGYTYNPVGTIATWSQQAGSGATATNTLTYDAADQLVTSTNVLSGTNTSNNYAYDPAGNRLGETTSSNTASGQFNNLNQLIALGNTLSGSTTNQTVAGYTSAAVTNVTVNAVPATISTNETNFTATVPLPNGTNIVSIVAQPSASNTPISTKLVQFSTSASGSAPAALTYDANGNCTEDENGNEYTWDALNRLVAIVYTTGSNAGNHTEMAYDGLSRRVQIVERDGTTIGSGTITSTKNYVWVGSEIAEERNASNTVTKRFFPQGEQQAGTNYYYTRDHLGSVRELVNSSGTILTRYSYDPYGRTTPSYLSGSTDATFQFTGDYHHAASGLLMTRNALEFPGREYDTNTGRWLSRDPIQENGGIDLYQYCANDPTTLIDPFGKDCLTGALIGGAGGAVIGAGTGATVGIVTGPGEVIIIPAGTIIGGGFGAILGCAGGIIWDHLPHIPPVQFPNPNVMEARGKSDPYTLPQVNPGRCPTTGKCNPCPPDGAIWQAPGNAHGSTNGVHYHQWVYNQNPKTCECYPQRLSGPTPTDLK